jgi:peptidoglycan/LPS O-acetylase OafA/YrhL
MMVAVLHTARYLMRTDDDPFAHVALQQGVSFFFVLSGFILFYKYPKLENARARFKFWVYRVARIWPAHFTTALLFMLTLPSFLWWTAGNRTPLVILSNITMLHAFIPPVKFYFGLNTPSWSISCEFFFYLMFPFLLAGWNKNWWIKLLASACVVGMVLFAYSFYAPHEVTNQNLYFLRWVAYINPVVRIFEFILGMSTALLFTRTSAAFAKWTVPEVTWLQVTALFVTFLSLAICSTQIRVNPIAMPSPYTEWLVGSGGAFAYSSLIFAMAQSKGTCSNLLSNPILVWLGEISYSIYLVHYLLLDIYLVYLAPVCVATNQPIWLCYSVYWAALIAVCATIYYLVERPARKLLPKIILGATESRSLQPLYVENASGSERVQVPPSAR